ncbi:Asp23/Gls24 family envelope stress response protein [Aciduricibacillus chroicocephali]|uniref:Asp23/Gls24 family envelope stress response protein n=1 Tax=Aciduricibacillus chroicocephali TaxID=3054939 RepID=A0ABY9KRT3_9BACI|nr:Asp23/Gls24 family envelope stress response protein [Bacillaceae bacterium 44XB]
MDEKHLLDIGIDETMGKVEIAPDVIEVIAGIAASEVTGVWSLRGSFAERLGKKTHSKGVKVDLRDDSIGIDLYAILKMGVSIPAVCQEIQQNIKQSIKSMTSLHVSEVNIHVVGMQAEERSASASGK